MDLLFSGSDTSSVIDSLMKEFDAFLDSLTKPKSFFTVNVTLGSGLFSFENQNTVFLVTKKKLILSPSAGYYHKSGFGFSVAAFMMSDEKKWTTYQYAFSPSYDKIGKSYSTGIAYTRYINKDSLNFYTTPIRNELFTYFAYKKWWLRPSISVSYGWGSKTAYEERKFQRYAQMLDHAEGYYIIIRNQEQVKDLSINFAIRKDFGWYDVFGRNDQVTITPVLLLNSGTQNFGFNTSYSYVLSSGFRINEAPVNRRFTDNTRLRPQSLSFVLRTGYMKKNFLLQPQVLFDYYLPESEDPLHVVFSVSAGLHF
ncbi:MAG TPA: hypothetical protein VM012_07205 [Flavitalea sp.]|nr:hypothetical protein [Flavitalea sp.]